MSKVQLQATFTIDDDNTDDLIDSGKLRAEAFGGDPAMIVTPGDALVELFELNDDEGSPFVNIEGVTIDSIEAVTMCASPGCPRKEHR